MSTLLSALVSRQLLLRCGTSKWSPILCHNQNYDVLPTQRFSSEFKYNNDGVGQGSNWDEPEQQQQSTFERHNINTRNNRRLISDYLGDHQVSANKNHYSAPIFCPQSTFLTGGLETTVAVRHFSTTSVLEKHGRGHQGCMKKVDERTSNMLATKYGGRTRGRPGHRFAKYMQDRRLLMAVIANRNFNTAFYVNRIPKF